MLGGEPFELANQKGLLPVIKKAKEKYPNKKIWCYSGYLFDKDIVGNMAQKYDETKEMLKYVDFLVDGKFEESQKNPSLQFRGSANQRIIDVQKSLKQDKVVLWDGETD